MADWLKNAEEVPESYSPSWMDQAEEQFEPTSMTESGALGTVQGLTAGFSDEIEAGLLNPTGGAKAAAALTGLYEPAPDDPDVAAYKARRDSVRRYLERARKSNPITYGAGNLGGAVLGPGKLIAPLRGGAAMLGVGGLAGLNRAGESTSESGSKIAKDAATDATVGVLTAGVLSKLGQGASSLKNKFFRPSSLADDADDVAKAVQEISGQKHVPGYLVTNDPTTKRLSSTLVTQPSLGGQALRHELNPLVEGIKKNVSGLTDDATHLSRYQAGEQVQKGIQQGIQKKLAPSNALYDELEKQLAGAPVKGVAWRRVMNRLKKDVAKYDFTGKSNSLIDQIDDTFTKNVKNVSDLKRFRTNIGKFLGPDATDAEKSVMGEVYQALTRERNRSILDRAVVRSAKGQYMKKALAQIKRDEILQKLKEADAGYRKVTQEIGDSLPIRTTKNKNIIRASREYLQNTTPEKIYQQAFNTNDVGKFQSLKNNFPKEFDVMRRRYLKELVEKSKNNTTDEFSEKAFINLIFKQPKEVRQILLGGKEGTAENLQKVFRSIPDQFSKWGNPSGTSMRSDFLKTMNPLFQGKSVADYAWLKGTTPDKFSASKMSESARRFGMILESSKNQGKFGLTYFMLMNRSPEFRSLVEQHGYDPESQTRP